MWVATNPNSRLHPTAAGELRAAAGEPPPLDTPNMRRDPNWEVGQDERRAPSFERSRAWAVLVIAATGPILAWVEFGVRPRTPLGWLILVLSAPGVAAGYHACERLFTWLGRLDVLGSLESSGRRLVPAIVVGAAGMAAVAAAVLWWTGNTTSAALFKRVLAENFKRGV